MKRKGVESLQWKPLLLSPLLTGTQCDRARILKFVASLQQKSNRVLPMLPNTRGGGDFVVEETVSGKIYYGQF